MYSVFKLAVDLIKADKYPTDFERLSEEIESSFPFFKPARDQVSKGQLISKCLFGVFNFFQKTNERYLSRKVEFV